MANDLIPFGSSATTAWQPKEQKYIRWGISGVSIFLALMLVVWVIKLFVPSLIDAVGLIHQLFDNAARAIVSVFTVLLLLWVGRETFLPGGRINGLFAQAYNSFISRLTWALLEIDPMTPLYERKKAVLAEKADFEQHFEEFDGVIARLQDTEERYRADAAKAQGQAKAAQAKGNQTAFENQSYLWGTCRDTADQFAQMVRKLAPVRDNIKNILNACETLITRLDIDIRVTKDKWDAQQNLSAINKSARRILHAQERYQLAQDAETLVQTRYAAEFGKLENLKTIAAPLLESIDLQKGGYSQELLDQWNAAPKLIESPTPAPLHLPDQSGSGLSSLIH